jgi:hypothetical protein
LVRVSAAILFRRSFGGTIGDKWDSIRRRPNVPDEPFNLRVDRDRFVPLASLAIGVAIGMAVVLGVSRVNGHYFVIVSPFYAFLPSAIPVEGQPFFGGPARTTVQGSGTSVGLQLNEALPSDVSQQLPVPVHNISVFTNFVTFDADTSGTGSPGVALQQAFIQIDILVLGSMETAFADNDALPPTLDLAGPNARVSIMQTSSTMMGQGRLSYWLHQMPTD